MTGYQSKQRRSHSVLSFSVGVLSLLLTPFLSSGEVRAEEVVASEDIAAAIDQEPLRWAEIIFLRNRAQLLREDEDVRRANVADRLNVGDALRTLRRSRAELRFNDDSLARIGERATFQFTPNTRNFQLTNGTVLLLIPPSRGRTTIQTPNAVTGIQGSALFVRYIPETNTTIVGALTDNPNGPMVLFNEDGTEQQALRANEVGVIEGDRITELYRLDSELFWQSSPLAEGFDYSQDSPTGTDSLDAVRQEIREAISKQEPLLENDESIIENPDSFRRPVDEPVEEGSSDQINTPEGSAAPTQEETKDDSGEATTSSSTSNQGEVDATSTESQGATSGSSSSENGGASAAVNSSQPSGSSVAGSASTPDASTPDTEGTALTESSPDSGSAAEPTDSGSLTSGSPLDSSSLGSNGSGVESPSGPDTGTPDNGAQQTLPAPVVEPENQAPLEPVVPVDPVEAAAEAAEEPVVEIQFEGTPAEEYLSVPQSQVQTEVPELGENNDLVSAEAAEVTAGDPNSSAEETNATVTSDEVVPLDENAPATESVSPNLDSDVIDTAIAQEELPDDVDEKTTGVDLDTSSVEAVIEDVVQPVSLKDPLVEDGLEENLGEVVAEQGAESENLSEPLLPADVGTPTTVEPPIGDPEPLIDVVVEPPADGDVPIQPDMPIEPEVLTEIEPPVEVVETPVQPDMPIEPEVLTEIEPPVEVVETPIQPDMPIEPEVLTEIELPVDIVETPIQPDIPIQPEISEGSADLLIPVEQPLLEENVNPEIAIPVGPIEDPVELVQPPETGAPELVVPGDSVDERILL